MKEWRISKRARSVFESYFEKEIARKNINLSVHLLRQITRYEPTGINSLEQYCTYDKHPTTKRYLFHVFEFYRKLIRNTFFITIP